MSLALASDRRLGLAGKLTPSGPSLDGIGEHRYSNGNGPGPSDTVGFAKPRFSGGKFLGMGSGFLFVYAGARCGIATKGKTESSSVG
jgi:hypothetical protein